MDGRSGCGTRSAATSLPLQYPCQSELTRGLSTNAAYDEMLHKRAEKLEERALLGGVLGGLVTGVGSTAGGVISGVTGALGNLVNGLATGGASNVDASNRFPDANHPFQAPGPTE